MKKFWFAPESPRPLALVRIGIGATYFVDCAMRWPHVVELYSTSGRPMPMFPDTVLHPWEPAALPAVLLYAGLLFALACVVLGWWTRLSLVAAAALLAWTGLLDLAGTLKKYTVVGVHLMALLAFTRCGAAWSLDRLFDPLRRWRQPLTPAWPRRLIQLLVCSVYVGAAVTKFRTPDFATGDLLFFSLLDPRWGGDWLGMWLAARPRLLLLSSYATLLFEAAFPLLIWVPRLRRPMLVAAAAFHVSLGYVMALAVFTPTMLAALCAFLDERDLRLPRWRRTAAPRKRAAAVDTSRPVARSGPAELAVETAPGAGTFRGPLVWRVASFAGYVLTGAAALAGGLAHQRSADWYGVFHGRPPVPLSPVADDRFEDMLGSGTPRSSDYIYRVELGERISSHHAFGESRRFRPGQSFFLLVRFIQPNPPMRIEIVFIDPEGDEHVSVRHVPRQQLYLPIEFRMTHEHLPGHYEIIVKANGYVAAKKSFELLAGEDQPVPRRTLRD